MKIYFDHERLNVYQESLEFIRWVEPILQKISKTGAVRDQLDRASTSVPLNIAEGNGKFTAPDRCRFFDIARGSSLESAACLDVLFIKKKLSENELHQGKERLHGIVSMLVGLIRSNSPDRLHDKAPEYKVDGPDQSDE